LPHGAHRGATTLAAIARAFVQCGILTCGLLRLRCGDCGDDKQFAFSCRRRGSCPSYRTPRVPLASARLAHHVVPHMLVRQWVLSLPIPLLPLLLLLAAPPKLVTLVLQAVPP
jgi:hypothetical protein